jgi:hypothetical protein
MHATKGGIAEKLDGGIDPKGFSPERFENIINSRIQPRVENVTILPIRLSTGRIALVVAVPQAKSRAPHQGGDKKYYKRYNRTVSAMEDYEIRDVMRRGTEPELVGVTFVRQKDRIFPKVLSE